MGRARLELRVSSLVLVRNSTKQLILLLPVRIKTEAQIMLSRLLFAVLLTGGLPGKSRSTGALPGRVRGLSSNLEKGAPGGAIKWRKVQIKPL